LASGSCGIIFPDPNLEAAIREAIGKPEGPIYPSDLEGLTYLDANERNIADLTGLEYCTDLIELRLQYNQISDISPLANLTNLTDLWLGSCWPGINQISDLSPLANLTNLLVLYLDGNQISDISPLANLTNLTDLSLQGNQISDLSPVANLTNLTYLWLDCNGIISDISPLASLTNLTRLSLWWNQISDISPLANLTNLRDLWLEYNQISNICPLVGNSGLGAGDMVSIFNNQLSSYSINICIPQLRARGVIVIYDEYE
jgi:Leucine-rich repeat (LRR) protein